MQQTANGVDEVKRTSSPNRIIADYEAQPISFQETNSGRAFAIGSPRQTHRRTITSHVIPIKRKRRPGFLKAASFKSGSQQDLVFGSMENVCNVLRLFPTTPTNGFS